MKLTAIIPSFNEAQNIGACLESLQALGAQILVVDSGSTDATRDIAKSFGAVVVEHPFETHAKQWHWALSELPIRTDWVIALDADQRLTPELAKELRRMFSNGNAPAAAVGLYVNRRQVFRGKWIRHGGYYPKYLLKIFRRDRVRVDLNDLLDHHFYVDGPTVKLRSDLIEKNVKEDDIGFWIEKHNRYASLLAREESIRSAGAAAPLRASLTGSPDQRILRFKSAWRSMPLYIRPILYFIYRYFFRLGCLDGKQGFIFHFMQAFWFRLLVDIKLDDLRTQAPAVERDGGQTKVTTHA